MKNVFIKKFNMESIKKNIDREIRHRDKYKK